MPAFIKTDKDERLWSKAKELANKEGKPDDYAYITGIWKKMKKQESIQEMKNILSESKQIKKEFFDSSSARDAISDEEMLKASIAAELDAASLYKKYAEITSNNDIKKIMLDISKEEDVHTGEFTKLLENINSETKKDLETGKQEVEDKLKEEKATELSGFIEAEQIQVEAPTETEYDLYEFYIGCIKESETTDDFEEMVIKVLNNLKTNSEYYTSSLKDDDYVEYQVPSGSNINVGRMIKNMSKAHLPKFDTKRNMADRFKVMFKMPTPKDDMNAANQSRESFESKESYNIIGEFTEEKEAVDVLKNLLQKKRNAKMMTDKDGKFIIIVEQ